MRRLGDDQHFILNPSVWEDAAAWGILLVDIAKQVARAFEEQRGVSYESALQRVKAGFDAEWAFDTDQE